MWDLICHLHAEMLKCVRQRLLDAQLSPAEEEMVEEHLEHCDACAEMIDAMDAQRLKPPRLQFCKRMIIGKKWMLYCKLSWTKQI